MPGADGMSSKFMKNAFVGWTFTAGLYYPPDFDATKLMPMKHLKPKGPQMMNIRMMFPFTMVCDSCHEYNYTGTKFTAKVEQIKHESYIGLKVYRFYGRCRHCWAEFTFKTDPKNSDYTMESGGKRTYEAWKDADMVENQLKAEKERDAEDDQMKALEQKSIDVQAQMQRIEDLDAIRTVNKRQGARDQSIEDALEFLFKREEESRVAEQGLTLGEAGELEHFREAQAEQRRQILDDAVEGSDDAPAAASQSRASTSSSAGAAIAAAVAERASSLATSQAAVGARFSVKRKAAPEGEGGDAGAKRSCTAPAASGGTVEAAEAGGAGGAGCGMLGLGSYDSDDSA